MERTRIVKALVVATALPLLYLAEIAPDAPLGLTLVPAAHAVVGAPLTPLSVAGVARRSTVRAASAASANTAANTAATSQQQAATAQQQQATAEQQAAAARPAGAPAVGTVVNSLPDGCLAETVSGVEYQNCGGVYYRAAFQGNNLVYVVQ
jgi:hypothetical protein